MSPPLRTPPPELQSINTRHLPCVDHPILDAGPDDLRRMFGGAMSRGREAPPAGRRALPPQRLRVLVAGPAGATSTLRRPCSPWQGEGKGMAFGFALRCSQRSLGSSPRVVSSPSARTAWRRPPPAPAAWTIRLRRCRARTRRRRSSRPRRPPPPVFTQHFEARLAQGGASGSGAEESDSRSRNGCPQGLWTTPAAAAAAAAAAALLAAPTGRARRRRRRGAALPRRHAASRHRDRAARPPPCSAPGSSAVLARPAPPASSGGW